MQPSLHNILASYNDRNPLEQAYTVRLRGMWRARRRTGAPDGFGRTWQVAAGVIRWAAWPVRHRDLAGEPLVIVRGNDEQLRAFYNVCRHHAAAV